MLKCDEIAKPESCLNKAEEQEPIFVLLGRDLAAPTAIKRWCDERIRLGKNKPYGDPQIQEALELAARMREYRNKKVNTVA